jgi:SulP family sulfate permease
VIAGAAFSLLAFLRRTAYPEVTELGYVPDKDAFLGMRSHPEARAVPGALVARFDAPLYYANAAFLEESLEELARSRDSPLRLVVLDCRGVDTIDATAVETLMELAGSYRARGSKLTLAHAKKPVRERLLRGGAREAGLSSYPTVRDALAGEGIAYDEPGGISVSSPGLPEDADEPEKTKRER